MDGEREAPVEHRTSLSNRITILGLIQLGNQITSNLTVQFHASDIAR